MSVSSISQLTKQSSAYLTEFPGSHPYLYKTAYHSLCLGIALYFGQSLIGRAALLGATHSAGHAAKIAWRALFPAAPLPRSLSPPSGILSFTRIELGIGHLQILQNQTVTQLSLLECTSLSDQMVDRIIFFIKSNTLTHLAVSYTALTDAQANALAEALSTNRSLQECRLSFCLSSEESIAHIATSLATHPTVRTLHLESNTITGPDPAIKAVARLIKSNRVLQDLVFSYQMFQDPGSKILAEALMQNTSLTSLDLSKNAMTQEAYQLLQISTQERSSLHITLPSSPSSFNF